MASSENVFLFVPNLIGYARVITGLWSCWGLPSSPVLALVLYGISGILDAFDGHAARLLNQSTRFGAVLDMVTDRSATACLMVYLATVYPAYLFAFQVLIALDLSSHYMQMYASLTSGQTSHKSMRENVPWLMRMYYTNRVVLFLVCFGNEVFFMGLYALIHWSDNSLVQGVTAVATPVFLFKQYLNIVQLVEASQSLAQADRETRRKGKGKAKD